MKHVLLACIFLSFGQTICFGQREKSAVPASRSALYLELIGNAIGISANYDFLLYKNLSLRFGVGGYWCGCDYEVSPPFDSSGGYWEYDPPGTSTGLFILMANYLTGGPTHHLEIGGGILYVFDDPSAMPGSKKNERFLGTFTFGYRLQPNDGGFVARFGVTPMVNSSGIVWSGGVSIGGAF